jgi:hypothetical protein
MSASGEGMTLREVNVADILDIVQGLDKDRYSIHITQDRDVNGSFGPAGRGPIHYGPISTQIIIVDKESEMYLDTHA